MNPLGTWTHSPQNGDERLCDVNIGICSQTLMTNDQ